MASALLPLVRDAVATLIDADEPLTAENVRAYVMRDVDAYRRASRTVAHDDALQVFLSRSIETALRAYPALPNGVHIDITTEKDPAKIRELRDYRTTQIADLVRSRQDLDNRLAQMTLDEELADVAAAAVEVPAE